MKKQSFTIIVLLFIISSVIFAEEKSKKSSLTPLISVGLGYPEFTHFGVGLTANQSEVLFTLGKQLIRGTTPGETYTGTLVHKHHLWGESKFTKIKPIYLETGLAFLKTKYDLKDENESFIIVRYGFDYNSDEHLGLTTSLGALIVLQQEESRGMIDLQLPILPTIQASFYWRF